VSAADFGTPFCRANWRMTSSDWLLNERLSRPVFVLLGICLVLRILVEHWPGCTKFCRWLVNHRFTGRWQHLGIFYGSFYDISSTTNASWKCYIWKSFAEHCSCFSTVQQEEINERRTHICRMLSGCSYKTGCCLKNRAVSHAHCPMFIFWVDGSICQGHPL
jgi:hypothetical protein